MNSPLGLSRTDRLSAAALWVATVAVFAAGAARLGFYYDDSTWLATLPSTGLRSLWPIMAGYIPGRNLFPLWQWLLFQAVGDPVSRLAAVHFLQSALDGVAVAGFFLLLRWLSLPPRAAVLAAGLFAFWPIHGETHFWLTAIPQNLIATIFVLLFTATTLLGVRSPHTRRWWLWPLEALAFFGALFTYDQVFAVLLGLLVLRLVLLRKVLLRKVLLRKWAANIPYLAALALFVWLKLRIPEGAGPLLRAQTWPMLRSNLLATASDTVGPLWLRHVAPLWSQATLSDWLLALLAAAFLTWLASRLPDFPDPPVPASPRLPVPPPSSLPSPPGSPVPASPRLPISPLPSLLPPLFYLAAYLPAWLWHLSARHHYLPSVGLFAGVAICLAWILERTRTAALRGAILIGVGGVICAFAAAGRGESRFWEQSFALKRQFFTDLRPELEGKQVLLLEDFPSYLGPAYLFSPHDAALAPRLLYHKGTVAPDFHGDISGTPAPGGVFLHTRVNVDGLNNFRFYPARRSLVVRFLALDGGQVRFEANPQRPAFYRLIASSGAPSETPFAVRRARARREGAETVLDLQLDVTLPPGAFLAATLSYFQYGGFHPWGRLDSERGLDQLPMLVGERAGGFERDLILRVAGFPDSERIRCDFWASSSSAPPAHLGRAEAPVASGP